MRTGTILRMQFLFFYYFSFSMVIFFDEMSAIISMEMYC